MSAGWTIRVAQPRDADAWCALRSALWPEEDVDAIVRETHAFSCSGRDALALVAVDAAGVVIGFAEAKLRRDYVNGAATSPAGFLEGLYVVPARRRAGIGRALVCAVEGWVRESGCRELASDADLSNVAGHAAHRACGFAETGRVVYFLKRV